MPSKNVIILSKPDARTFHYVMWADVPVARRPFYAQVGRVSVWTAASAAENNALADGSVAERADTVQFPVGVTIGQAQAALETLWAGYQAEITALNKWTRYGTFWNGTSWTAGGVA